MTLAFFLQAARAVALRTDETVNENNNNYYYNQQQRHMTHAILETTTSRKCDWAILHGCRAIAAFASRLVTTRAWHMAKPSLLPPITCDVPHTSILRIRIAIFTMIELFV
jgi:hypothetical protein